MRRRKDKKDRVHIMTKKREGGGVAANTRTVKKKDRERGRGWGEKGVV